MLVKTYVNQSSIEGLGLFAGDDIPAGTLIWAYHENFDQVLDDARIDAMPAWQSEFFKKYCFSNNDLYYYCIDDARFMNHSSKPNVIDKPEGTVAARRIKAGEEICCDYAGMGHTEKDMAFNAGFLG